MNLTGQGFTIGVWERGKARLNHVEYDGRVEYQDTANAGAVNDGHASHVIGTICASGIEPQAKGMAPASQIATFDWENDLAEIGAFASQGHRIVNQSYGISTGWSIADDGTPLWWGNVFVSETEDFYFGFYSSVTRSVDSLVYEHPELLMVRSAGNDRNEAGPEEGELHYVYNPGPGDTFLESFDERDADGPLDCISHGGVAKNVLTVGAIEDLPNGYETAGEVILATFSSVGPVDDGRIKPDLVANGLSVWSCGSTAEDAYGYRSGTSMAAPTISGSAALLQEKAQSELGELLDADAMKALLIHTADEAGVHPGPDYFFGWGVANIERAAQVITDLDTPSHDFINDNIAQGDGIGTEIYSDGTEPLKITIVWTDPPGNNLPLSLDPETPALINNLDLLLFHQDGEMFLPYVLDKDDPYAAATTGFNDIDNVEQIFIADPLPGTYSLEILFGTMGTLDQDFALFISGSSSVCPEEPILEVSGSGLNWQIDIANFSSGANTFIEWNLDGNLILEGIGSSTLELTLDDVETHTVCAMYIANDCPQLSSCVDITGTIDSPCDNQPLILEEAAFGEVTDIEIDGQGIPLFIYGGNSLCYYDQNDPQYLSENDWGASNGSQLYGVEIDNKGNWWLGSDDGLFLYDGSNWSQVDAGAVGINLSGAVMHLSSNAGQTYFYTSDNQLINYSSGIFDNRDFGDLFGTIYDIQVDLEGKLFLATQLGVVEYVSDVEWSFLNEEEIKDQPASALGLGSQGELMIKSQWNKLYSYYLGNMYFHSADEYNSTSIFELNDFTTTSLLEPILGYVGGAFLSDAPTENYYDYEWKPVNYPNSSMASMYNASAVAAANDGYWIGGNNLLAFFPYSYKNPIEIDVPSNICRNSEITIRNLTTTNEFLPEARWYVDDNLVSNNWDLTYTFTNEFATFRLEVGDEGSCFYTRHFSFAVQDCLQNNACDPRWKSWTINDYVNDAEASYSINSASRLNDDFIYTARTDGQGGSMYRVHNSDLWFEVSGLEGTQTYCTTGWLGSAYLGGANAIYQVQGNHTFTYTSATNPNFPTSFVAYSSTLDSYGNIWFGLLNESNILIRTSDGTWMNESIGLPSSSNNIQVEAGPNGEIYIATEGGLYVHEGINSLNENAIFLRDLTPDLGAAVPTNMVCSRYKKLWFSYDNVLGSYDNDVFEFDAVAGAAVGGEITGIANAYNGAIWMCGTGGLKLYDIGVNVQDFTFPGGSNNFTFIDKGTNDSYWLGNETQLIEFFPKYPYYKIEPAKTHYCLGEEVVFSVDLGGRTAEVSWDYDEGTLANFTNEFNLYMNEAGTHTISTSIFDFAGCFQI